MAPYTLVIGNKAYSSWSLRPWLLLKQAQIPFEEVRIALYQDDHAAKIRRYSPAGKVPILIDKGAAIWESLAICEYLAERHADKQLWPSDPAARAFGRAISAEMHAGFSAMRGELVMNVRHVLPRAGIGAAVAVDIARIEAIWNDSLRRYGGPFLLGAFSVADAMFAPVATRFRTYAVALSVSAQRYANTVLALPAMQEWYAAAAVEPEVLPQYEP